MTAEVAVLNKSAIAVAADSAVTRGRNKVHVSANKIFQIHKTQPIGALIYNYAEIHGFPWELVIKTFREQFSDTTFKTISECKARFVEFLSHPSLLTEQTMEQDVTLLALDRLNRFLPNERLPNRRYNSEFAALLKRRSSIPSSSAAYSFAKFRRKYGDLCNTICDPAITPQRLSSKNRAAFVEAVYNFIASSEQSSYRTGFAIFGYGTQELLPTLEHAVVDGAPLGQLRIVDHEGSKISNTFIGDAEIYAFAQSDAASLFMEGISPGTKQFFYNSIQRSIDAFSGIIFEDISPMLRDPDEAHVAKSLISKHVKDYAAAYREQIDKYIAKNSVSPVLASLDGLGKEDMAKLAEAIVELASMKLRVSTDAETVGGPIDVAVVSKIDGFVWIKRKHYFDFDLNRAFYLKYHDKRFDLTDGGDA